jgi:competence ComEA-like helix-hairpin-helix protein
MRLLISIAFLMSAAAAVAQEPAAEKSKAVFEKVCSGCHQAEAALATRRSKEQWQETFDKMVGRGLQASDEDLTVAFNYLVARYGRVNVNRAAAADIAEILAVTAKDADAIVKYRKESGRFEDFESLAKVPGIDLKQLEKSREAISF